MTLQRLRYFVREALVGFYRGRGSSAVTVAIIAASLTIPGGFLLLAGNLETLAQDWNRVQVNAYFRDDAVEQRSEEVKALVASVQSRPIVREARYVTREEALQIFRSRFASLTEAADSLQVNPLPASLEVAVRGEASEREAATGALIAELKASPLVEMVQDNEQESRRLLSIVAVVSRVGYGLGGVVAAASAFIIFNVIRLTVQSRRDEIFIMRLVGATGGFIRGPFLVEGMLQGLAGAALALGLLYAGHLAVADYAARTGSSVASLLSGRFISPVQTLAVPAAGLLIGLTGSALSLRRHLAR